MSVNSYRASQYKSGPMPAQIMRLNNALVHEINEHLVLVYMRLNSVF